LARGGRGAAGAAVAARAQPAARLGEGSGSAGLGDPMRDASPTQRTPARARHHRQVAAARYRAEPHSRRVRAARRRRVALAHLQPTTRAPASESWKGRRARDALDERAIHLLDLGLVEAHAAHRVEARARHGTHWRRPPRESGSSIRASSEWTASAALTAPSARARDAPSARSPTPSADLVTVGRQRR
jgi:hypothetical protein